MQWQPRPASADSVAAIPLRPPPHLKSSSSSTLLSHVLPLPLPRVYSFSSLLSRATTASPMSSVSPEAASQTIQTHATSSCVLNSPRMSDVHSSPPVPVCTDGMEMTPRAIVARSPSSSGMEVSPESVFSLPPSSCEEGEGVATVSSLDTLAQAAMMSSPQTQVQVVQSSSVASTSSLQLAAQSRHSDRPQVRQKSAATRQKSKLPPGVSSFNHSTYMSEVDFIAYFQRCNSLSEAVGAIGHDWPSYKAVSVYARARRLQLKYDASGQLLLQGKALQFVALGAGSTPSSVHSIWRGRKSSSTKAKRARVTMLQDSSDTGATDDDLDSSSSEEEGTTVTESSHAPVVPAKHAPRETRADCLAPTTDLASLTS